MEQKWLSVYFMTSSLPVFKENKVVVVCIYHRPLLGAASTAEVGAIGPVLLSQETAPFLPSPSGTRGSGRRPCCLYAALLAHSFQRHAHFVGLVVSHYSLYIYMCQWIPMQLFCLRNKEGL